MASKKQNTSSVGEQNYRRNKHSTSTSTMPTREWSRRGEWEGDGSGLLEDGDDGTGSRRDDHPSMRVGIVSQIDDVAL